MQLKANENRIVLDAVQVEMSYCIAVLPKNLIFKICFLHVDETCCLTLKENLGLRISESNGQRKIFGAKRDEIIRENLRIKCIFVNFIYIVKTIISRMWNWLDIGYKLQTREIPRSQSIRWPSAQQFG
jgi:hypothetical protein